VTDELLIGDGRLPTSRLSLKGAHSLRYVGLAIRSLVSGDLLRELRTALRSYYLSEPGECPCCGYSGLFISAGIPARGNADCPKCHSLERHRLFKLALSAGFVGFRGKRVLHFAPERAVTQFVGEDHPASYATSSYPHHTADLLLNIEAIELPAASIDSIICSHVLEHVDDRLAMSELYRVLCPGGELVAAVPLIEGWDVTFEDASVTTEQDRLRFFGKTDHVRYYGRDFRDRLKKVGFTVREFTADGRDSARYKLIRGDKLFVASKPRD